MEGTSKNLHVVTKDQNKKCACHMKGKIENMPITWKARKKNAYNMKLQFTNFLTWKLEYMQNNGKQKFQVPI